MRFPWTRRSPEQVTYYKAVTPSGWSFYDRRVTWKVGKVTHHPQDMHIQTRMTRDTYGYPLASRYLSASVDPMFLPGCDWPLRLLTVEPVGAVWTPNLEGMPNKRAAAAWKVLAEVDPDLVLGPNRVEVRALLDWIDMFGDPWSRLDATRAAGEAYPIDARTLAHQEVSGHSLAHNPIFYASGLPYYWDQGVKAVMLRHLLTAETYTIATAALRAHGAPILERSA